MPGSRIPIVGPERLVEERPDEVLVLPWNLTAEIRGELAAMLARGTRLVTAIPELAVS
jgi:hypothetical protein